VTYLRSSAKPFQTLPLIEMGGLSEYQITERELAITCASHSGTDQHLKIITSLQRKTGFTENDLLCCTHQPFHKSARELIKDRGELPTQNHHNCSGKHTGMLAQAKLLEVNHQNYTEADHPVQQLILKTIAEMCCLDKERIQISRDGCSVPTFAMSLYHAAWGWARLVNPSNLAPERISACNAVTTSMINHPFLVAGPGRLDTRLMECAPGKLISKAGAEAFQAAGIPKNRLKPGSPALGIALKISDGDQGKRAKKAVMIEVLRQLGLLSEDHLIDLAEFGPTITNRNQCDIVTGAGKPCFQLQYN
jgi:L-asparaginase II